MFVSNHPFNILKRFKLMNNRLVKKLTKREEVFYEKIYPYFDDVHEFLPRYYGLITINQECFLKTENFITNPDHTNLLMFNI